MSRSRLLIRSGVAAIVAFAALSSPAHANSPESTSARAALKEVSVVASTTATYTGDPTRITFTGATSLMNLRKDSKGRIDVTSVWSVTSRGCTPPAYSLANAAIGTVAKSSCKNGITTTEFTLLSSVPAKAPANAAPGAVIMLFDVPMVAPRGSRFLSISLRTTVQSASGRVTLQAPAKSLPAH